MRCVFGYICADDDVCVWQELVEKRRVGSWIAKGRSRGVIPANTGCCLKMKKFDANDV